MSIIFVIRKRGLLIAAGLSSVLVLAGIIHLQKPVPLAPGLVVGSQGEADVVKSPTPPVQAPQNPPKPQQEVRAGTPEYYQQIAAKSEKEARYAMALNQCTARKRIEKKYYAVDGARLECAAESARDRDQFLVHYLTETSSQ